MPSKACSIQLVKIQSDERLAATSEPNSAPCEATRNREARGKGYWATTQVKGLSPEIFIVSEVETVHEVEDSSLAIVKQDGENPTGSETVARYQKESAGTWETQCVPEGMRRQALKGKESQMTHWESDKPIVAGKPPNRGGAKELTAMRWDLGETFARLRAGERMETKPKSLTACKGDVLLKSRVRANFKHGSVRGFIVDSQRRWL